MLASVAEPIAQLPAIMGALTRGARTPAVERSVLDGKPVPQTVLESVAGGDAVAALRRRVRAIEIGHAKPVVANRHAMRSMSIREQCVVRANVAVVRRVAHERSSIQILSDDVETFDRMQHDADRREVRVPGAVGVLIAAIVEV